MNQDGQIYFAPEADIPREDRKRFDDALYEAAKMDFEEQFERLQNHLSMTKGTQTISFHDRSE